MQRSARPNFLRLPTAIARTAILPALCAAVAGLALNRVLFELLFPHAVWLGAPLVAAAFALLAAAGGWWAGARLAAQRGTASTVALFLPLLLNAPAVLQPTSATLHSRLLFAASLWLTAAVALTLWRDETRQPRAALALLAAALLPVYLLTMGQTVGRADTFEFQVVIPKLGIVHPTGYPLYLLLGKLFTYIPFGPVAWRINLASVLFGAGAAGFVVLFVRDQLRGRAATLAGLLAALTLALGPTFWSQAIEAEVYALHALVVGAVLWGVGQLLNTEKEEGRRKKEEGKSARAGLERVWWLFLAVGVGLTNHLTTVILLPGVVLTALFLWWEVDRGPQTADEASETTNRRPLFAVCGLSLLLPLTLYAYLPLRWAAVNGEPMGWRRFVDWVIGGRFQGALRLDAFLTDPARYGVVGRLLLGDWAPPWLLLLAAVGLLWLFWRRPRLALVVTVTLLGYLYYGMSYYVPDLAVFLLPAQLILSLLWGVGLGAVLQRLWTWHSAGAIAGVAFAAILLALLVNGAATTWGVVDRSQADGGTTWAAATLALPLDEGAAILADSERFPPLYYLQQAEGVRPDLDIMVLPDEAAYRAELGARLAAGQTVYLARFLPGLEGSYHLRSLGPLVEVGRQPLQNAPPQATEKTISFDGITLLALQEMPQQTAAGAATAVTLYWQAQQPPRQPLYVYTRWQGENFSDTPQPPGGQHPANHSYPTAAWEAGEVVADYHLMMHPLLATAQDAALQVALAPPFSAPADLQWQTVTTVRVQPPQTLPQAQPLYAQVNGTRLDGVQVAQQARPQSSLPLLLSGCGAQSGWWLELHRSGVDAAGVATGSVQSSCSERFIWQGAVNAQREAGTYTLWAQTDDGGARCHWLGRMRGGCPLATVTISGAALPEGATNFGDRIALTSLTVAQANVQRGGAVTVDATWQALAPMERDYTLFVQVVDAQDRIVGQIDTWARQGTYPTSRWTPGEAFDDSYTVAITEDAPEGDYRLLIGWYLLASQERLPVLDEQGNIIEDRLVVPLPRQEP